MHVLITADTVGGVWTYTRELTCGLINRGHKVTLVSFGKIPTADQGSWVSGQNLTYRPTGFPLEWMQNARDGIAESTRYLESVINECRPDVLHLSQYCYGALAIGIPKIIVAHSDVRSWWRAVYGETPSPSSWIDWYTDCIGRGLACADAIVAPSSWMLEALRKEYDVRARCLVIHNGRNPDLFTSSARKNKSVLSVGRIWDEAKQIKLLLLREQCVPIGIAGSTKHPDKASSDDYALGRHNKCTFWGEQDELNLSALYSAAAYYAATSRYEPFGLAPVEAALSRCALIANDIPVFRELWGDAALYFKCNDADSLAESICTLSQSHLLQEQLGELAYEHACSRFTSARMVTAYEQLYSELIGKGARA